MYKIKTYNKISKVGLDVFDDKYTVGDEVENADGAIVRSASLHDTEFPETGGWYQQYSDRPLLRKGNSGLQYTRCQRKRRKGACTCGTSDRLAPCYLGY